MKHIISEWNVYGNDTKLIVAFRMFILFIYAYACLKKLNDVTRENDHLIEFQLIEIVFYHLIEILLIT
jgi:hypothetical protein